MNRTSKLIPLFIFLAFLAGVGGTTAIFTLWGRGNHPGEAPKEEATAGKASEEQTAGAVKLGPVGEKAAGIRVEPAAYRSVQATLSAPGVVEAPSDRVARITPPVAGKVTRILVRPGASVRAGQPVALLDSYEVAQARAAVRQAEAQIGQAEATLQTARAEVEQAHTRRSNAGIALGTQRDLAKAGAFSQAPLQAARSELADAQSDLLAAQAQQQNQETVYARTERLFKEGISSRSEMEAADLERQQDTTRVERAKARVENARQTLAREQRVAQGGLLNRQAVQAAEAEVRVGEGEIARSERQAEAAQTALSAARQALTATRANLAALVGMGQAGEGGTVTLVAPLDGIVTGQQATLGEAVERSTTLFVLENLSAVLVEAGIPEADVARVRAGQRVVVTVASFPGQQFGGIIQSLAGAVDEKTRTLPVRCLVQNPKGQLRPGMFAKVLLATERKREVLVVPEAAVDDDGDKRFVYVRENGGYARREIKAGQTFGKVVEITDGIKAGDAVVTAGLFTLKSESKKGELKGDED